MHTNFSTAHQSKYLAQPHQLQNQAKPEKKVILSDFPNTCKQYHDSYPKTILSQFESLASLDRPGTNQLSISLAEGDPPAISFKLSGTEIGRAELSNPIAWNDVIRQLVVQDAAGFADIYDSASMKKAISALLKFILCDNNIELSAKLSLVASLEEIQSGATNQWVILTRGINDNPYALQIAVLEPEGGTTTVVYQNDFLEVFTEVVTLSSPDSTIEEKMQAFRKIEGHLSRDHEENQKNFGEKYKDIITDHQVVLAMSKEILGDQNADYFKKTESWHKLASLVDRPSPNDYSNTFSHRVGNSNGEEYFDVGTDRIATWHEKEKNWFTTP